MYNQRFTKSERALKRIEKFENPGGDNNDQNLGDDDEESSSDEEDDEIEAGAITEMRSVRFNAEKPLYPKLTGEEPPMPNIIVNRNANPTARPKSRMEAQGDLGSLHCIIF